MLTKRLVTSLSLFGIILFSVSACATHGDIAEKPKTATAGLNIETWQTANGAKVFYVPAPQLPMVDVRVVFNAGSARDGDKPGLASMTNTLLDHGAGNWNTNQIVDRFDSVGAQFSTDSLRDMAVVSLRTLTDKDWFNTALDTMAVILQKPKFLKSELERERQRTLVALRNQQESPSDLADLAFYKALYQGQPYASPPLGTKESVSALTRQDVEAFYKKYYVASNAIVVIVGAVDKTEASAIANKLMLPMQKGEPAPVLPKVPDITEAKTVKQQHPSTQTTILVGQIGETRTDPDYFPLYVGNHILGGSGFGSRIVDEIREKRGLAYSSYSYFYPMEARGPFIMGLQTKNNQAKQALALLKKTVAKFIAEGPTPKEIDNAKKNITGGFPLRLDSNKEITEYVSMIGFYDLPLDYLKTFNARVESVTRAQIMDAFKRRVHPDRMITVMVGDLDTADSKSK
ncbi:MAG: insulinase family protein [Gammaproteobacteria bacterium]|nr:insulinase family protein [Gammaproteobacteria bacterium]